MRSIRKMAILLGLPLVFLATTAARANAQALETTSFSGTFTLPFTVHWGHMTLTAGDYNLYYGDLNHSSIRMVEVSGKDAWGPRGLALTRGGNTVSTAENVIVCIREGNVGYVRELRMGAIGESASFKIPHGVSVRARVIADKANANGKTKVAETAIVRLPIKLNTK